MTMGFFLVMKAELVRTFIIMRRYWFRTITGMIIGYSMLLMLVLGVMSNRGAIENMTRGQDAVNWTLGLMIGAFAFGIVGMFTQGLQDLSQSGQLEQLCMSPHGLVTNFMARSVVSSVSNILTQALMVWLIAKTVKGTLHADLAPTIVLLALTYFNLIGFGFMFGGLALVFKQTGQIATIIRLGLFGIPILASEKIEQLPMLIRFCAHIVPVTDATICMKYVLIQGQMIAVDGGEKVFRSVFLHPSFFWLIVNCLAWTIAGIICFKAMENWSRNKGTLGAY
jgi:ABC-2 type transport system permease protein